MTPLVTRSRRVTAVSADTLADQTEALVQALDAGGAALPSDTVAAARGVATKVAERMTMTGQHTVVALAGATGSGKSSVFNALVGEPVAEIGARRPTTAVPLAAVWGEPATELLDWLGVEARHHVSESATSALESLDSLVLLDLPDFDSRIVEHRTEVARLLGLVDVFVWVTDPQKYADAVLHHEFVSERSAHRSVSLTVLNQSDSLDGGAITACHAHLVRLLEADGVESPQVIVTSATTGFGIPALRQRLSSAVAARSAARHRLSADVVSVATALRCGVADQEPVLGEQPGERLMSALSRAAGVPVILGAVEKDYQREAKGSTGWLFTRWLQAFRPAPLRRLRLDRVQTQDGVPIRASDVRAVLGRSSLPPPTPAARAAVDLATREIADAGAAGLPVRWADEVSAAVSPARGDLADALDRAVVTTPLRARRPLWWQVMGIMQLVLGLGALAGLAWLVALSVAGWFQLALPDTPSWGPVALPTLLVVAGVLAGLGAAGLSRVLARIGARRRRRLIEARLATAIGAVAADHVVGPVRAVLARHARTRELLDEARLVSPPS